MKKSHAAQLFPRILNLLQGSAGTLNKAVKGRINGGHEQLVFILEIEIDCAVCHAGTVGNLRHAGVEEAVFSNDFNGGIQNALVLV